MAHQNTSSLRTLLYFFRAYPKQNILVVSCLVLAGFAELLGVTALLPLIGKIVGQEDMSGTEGAGIYVNTIFSYIGVESTLAALLFFVFFAISLKAGILFFTMRYVSTMAAQMSRQIRLRLMNALMKASWPYFTSLVTGQVANSISEQAQRAGICYLLAGHTVSIFLQLLVYIGFALLLSVHITLLAVVAGVMLAYTFKILVTVSRRAGQNITQSMDTMAATLNEALTGVKSIKAMGQEDRFISFMASDVENVFKAQRKSYTANLMMQLFYEPAIVLMLSLGLYYVITAGNVDVSRLLLLSFLFYRLLSQGSNLQSRYQMLAQAESALWSLIKQSEKAEAQAEKLSQGKAPHFEKDITFKDIAISYDGKNYLLQNFTKEIKANEITLIFGPSGSGKTTLTDTVLGLHEPKAGGVLIDGEKFSDIDVKAWRHMVGYVPQETFLFHDTIAHNVTLGDESFSVDDIEQALKAAAAWEFVMDMEDGLETIVGERGGRLSGGQRQRIALARSLVRKPKLLILDEATSGLDKQTEKDVMESLLALKDKTTVIIISHNPEMKKYADKVITFEGKSDDTTQA